MASFSKELKQYKTSRVGNSIHLLWPADTWGREGTSEPQRLQRVPGKRSSVFKQGSRVLR